MLCIKDHLLYEDHPAAPEEYTQWIPSPNFDTDYNRRIYMVVIHYTAGASAFSTAEWCAKISSRVAYHFIVGRDGEIIQQVACNKRAWHAGAGQYGAIKDINAASIGIGLANWGQCSPGFAGIVDPGQPVPPQARLHPEDVLYAAHKSRPENFVHWERYHAEQIASLHRLLCVLIDTYPIKEIVGHDDTAPNRKIDPGPAFPPLPFVLPLEGYRPALNKWLFKDNKHLYNMEPYT